MHMWLLYYYYYYKLRLKWIQKKFIKIINYGFNNGNVLDYNYLFNSINQFLLSHLNFTLIIKLFPFNTLTTK